MENIITFFLVAILFIGFLILQIFCIELVWNYILVWFMGMFNYVVPQITFWQAWAVLMLFSTVRWMLFPTASTSSDKK